MRSVRIFQLNQNYIKEWYSLHATNSCNWNVNPKQSYPEFNYFFIVRSKSKFIGENIFDFSCVQFIVKVKKQWIYMMWATFQRERDKKDLNFWCSDFVCTKFPNMHTKISELFHLFVHCCFSSSVVACCCAC